MPERDPFQPVAAALAFLFPGAGHWYLGYRDRAIRISAGVLGLFFFGIFVGGISCIDRRENFIWFLGQALTGPVAFATDFTHERMFKVVEPNPSVVGAAGGVLYRSPRPTEYRNPADASPIPISIDSNGQTWATLPNGQRVSPAYPPYIKGVGRMAELGTLFTTIAGFMNLICVIDAAFTRRREPSSPRGIVGTL